MLVFVAKTKSTLGVIWVQSETGLVDKGQGETEKEAGHPRLVGGRLNKKGNLHMGLSLAAADKQILAPVC